MFDNIGKKIKTLAAVLCVLGIIASVITGIEIMISDAVGIGFLVLILGSLLSWLGSFFTYGFGELIDTNQAIARKLAGFESKAEAEEKEAKAKSKAEAEKAEAKRHEEKYNTAKAAMADGNYAKAYMIFTGLPGYRDVDQLLISDEKLMAAAESTEAQWTVGNEVTFGAYPQTEAGTDSTPIEWTVLDNDGETALLISRYALDCKPYNTANKAVTWESCSLRSWLNGEFFDRAFGDGEKKQLAESRVRAYKNPRYATNPGNDTTDKVFLLSIDEAGKYFADAESRLCPATDYAIKNGAYINSDYKADNRACGWWWLRSPGYRSFNAANVSSDGSVYDYGNDVDLSGSVVRPVVRVRLF